MKIFKNILKITYLTYLSPKNAYFFYHLSLIVSSRFISQDSVPFAVIGSNTVVEVNGKRVRGRLYPWGITEGKENKSY